jgi:PAS domain S-box-containing protein
MPRNSRRREQAEPTQEPVLRQTPETPGEARLRFLLSQMPGILWTTDEELRLTSTVGSGLSAMNSRPNQELGKTIGQLFPTNPTPEAAHRRALAGTSATYETAYKGRVVSCHVDPLVDEHSRVVGVVGVAVDITEARHAENRLAARFAVTRVLAESATFAEAAPRVIETLCTGLGWDGGAVWEPDGGVRVLRCTQVWQPEGAAPFEVLEMSRRIVLPESVGLPGRVWRSGEAEWVTDVGPDGRCPRGAIAASEGLHATCGFSVRVNGDVRAVLEIFSRTVLSEERATLDMLSDVGFQMGQFLVRVHAVEDLARSQKQLSDAEKIAHLGCWEWDIVKNRVVWSDELYRIFGLVPQSVAVSYDFFLERVHPEDRQRVSDSVAQAVTGQQPNMAFEHRIVREDGTVRTLSAHAELVADGTGAPLRLTGTAQDITDGPGLRAVRR